MSSSTIGDRKILLLSDLPPCLNFTGGIYLRPLCAALPNAQLMAVVVRHPALQNAFTDPELKIKTIYIDKPRESAVRRGPAWFTAWMSRAQDFLHRKFWVTKVARQVVQICREQAITDVWCVLQGQTMVRLCNEVRERTGLRVYTQVWDPLGWWLRANNVDSDSAQKILRSFDLAITNSTAVACASIPMAALYRKQYGVSAVPLILGLPRKILQPVQNSSSAAMPFKIALSGQIYAVDEFQSLVGALDSFDWKIAGRTIELHYFGNTFHQPTPRNFVDHGWVSTRDLIPQLSQMDLLYCPYWFDRKFEEEARNSFPSKLTTYFAAGKPALFHGPPYSSAAAFIQARGGAYLCLEPGINSIGRSLQEIVSSDKSMAIAQRAADLFLEFFTEEKMQSDFLSYLKVGYEAGR